MLLWYCCYLFDSPLGVINACTKTFCTKSVVVVRSQSAKVISSMLCHQQPSSDWTEVQLLLSGNKKLISYGYVWRNRKKTVLYVNFDSAENWSAVFPTEVERYLLLYPFFWQTTKSCSSVWWFDSQLWTCILCYECGKYEAYRTFNSIFFMTHK